MVTFSTQIPDCDSHSTALLNLFISSEASICSAMAFPPLELHGRISLRSVLLLLLVNFMSGFRLELIYISLIENIRSSLTHLHVLQLPVLLLYVIKITFFVCTKRINLLILNWSSDRLVIVAEWFLKLPNLHVLIKQKSSLLPRNLALMTFSKLLIVFSIKVNLLYLLYSKAWKCCLLQVIKQNRLL